MCNSALGDDPLRMLRIIKRFGKHSSCHLHGECVVVKNAQPLHIHPEDGN
jgi:hypothetical protein